MPRTAKKTEDKEKIKKTEFNIPVYSLAGKEIKTIELPKEIFGIKESPRLISQYIRVYLANQRQGTASTKTRSEVVGSTKKIYKQKGTGRARHGASSAPIFVGGGVAGGPKPRDYSLRINSKQKQKALFCSLSMQKKNMICLESESLKVEPKTKNVYAFLQILKLSNHNTLLILPKMEKNNLVLASRNIPGIKIIGAELINPYEILKADKLIFVEDALAIIAKHFLKHVN
ncbi:MAG: 50S ribosomal protein L4 [Candidatus Roizmanbacteria bacterium GW2011_GWA2_36_23]|uniref:Large ribosomal subunit protein uL4 n=1 Tax=Candidatus Roizmanbacteria bacterium GW2011_GWA2_36_23 TaxID=1618480 RepID=A0A0G0EM15_9BACT|nr:MAG: 50S ribosomal protein L4 [Candidatus Roizmanbacteria bacterium GW2011_GWA2_36_23]